jgi:glycosyltransferase involved in cell wall biosynthesis
MNITVVIPVFNAEESLQELISRLRPVLSSLCKDYEVVLVNDGSEDDSWKMITQLAAENGWIRGIDLMRNYGQQNAALCGIRVAKHEIVVTLDDDLQHPPEEIPKLVRKLTEGYDVVYGTPEKKQHGFWRKLASLMARRILRFAFGSDIVFNMSAFRAFRTKTRDAFEGYHGPLVSIDVLLTWASTRLTSVKVRHDRRLFGESGYTLRKLVSIALVMITGFSTLPLRFASLAGFAFTIFGLIVLIDVVAGYFLRGGNLPGFAFLASIISIFSGVQLFALGVIGEYMAQMYFRTMDRPIYTIRGTTEDGGRTNIARIEPVSFESSAAKESLR